MPSVTRSFYRIEKIQREKNPENRNDGCFCSGACQSQSLSARYRAARRRVSLLDSLFVFAKDGDVVTVRESDSLSLDVSGPYADALPGGGENIVLKASRLLADACGRKPAAAVLLEKICLWRPASAADQRTRRQY